MHTMLLAAVRDEVVPILERITGSQRVRNEPDLALFDEGLLDSLGLMEVIVALSETFHIEIPPSSITREDWVSPSSIVRTIAARLHDAQKGVAVP